MTRITSKRIAGGAVLTGCVLFTGTPAYAAVAPEPEPPAAAQPSKAVIEHYQADTTGTTSTGISAGHQARTHRETGTPGSAGALTKAQVEQAERSASTGSSSVPGVLSAQTKAQVEHLEAQAAQQEAAASTPAASTASSDDDDVSAPLVVLALLGGGLIVGGGTSYTLRRMRHNGPVSTATA